MRRTLAFSIHHLAIILGEELTCTDLVPVFDELLKDLDEVRIGLLKHFVGFLQVTIVILFGYCPCACIRCIVILVSPDIFIFCVALCETVL